MRIDGLRGIPGMLPALQTAKESGSASFPPASARGAAAATTSLPAPVQSIAVLVALAEPGEVRERRREQVGHAAAGIDALASLEAALLAGAVGREQVRALRQWRRKRTRPDDPALAELLDEIELRILVELAKLHR